MYHLGLETAPTSRFESHVGVRDDAIFIHQEGGSQRLEVPVSVHVDGPLRNSLALWIVEQINLLLRKTWSETDVPLCHRAEGKIASTFPRQT